MKHENFRVVKWGGMHRAATLSVLVLGIASTRATEHTDIPTEYNSQNKKRGPPTTAAATSATGLLDGRESEGGTTSNRPFFIQDPSDGLCLSGSTFKRCAIDTLWRLEGSAGRQIVRRMPVAQDGESPGYTGYRALNFNLHPSTSCFV